MSILYGIKKVVLEELDPKTGLPPVTSGIVATILTGENADLDPVYSDGEEEVLRSPTEILAVVRTEDLLYGYDLKLKDNTFNEKVAQLVGGYKATGVDDEIVLSTPMMSEGALSKPFRLTLYIENYSGDSIINYCKIVLNKCRGRFPKMTIGKEFYAPEFEIKARENTKASLPIKTISFVDTIA